MYYTTVFLCFFQVLLFSESLNSKPQSRYKSIYFQPQKEEEYAQAWNVYFYNENYNLQLVYVIGNLGPGSLNSGYVIFSNHEKQSEAFIKELPEKNLAYKNGAFNYIFNENSSLQLLGNHEFKAVAVSESTTYTLRLTNPYNFPVLSLKTNLPDKRFVDEKIPLITPYAVLTIESEGEKKIIRGWGGLDYIGFNRLPNKFAKSFTVARSEPGSNMIVIMGFKGSKRMDEKTEMKYYYLKNYRLIRSENISEISAENYIEENPKPFVPEKIKMSIKDRPDCSIVILNKSSKGRLDTYASITPVLRWIFNLFFTEPVVQPYISTLTYICAGESFTVKALINYIALDKDLFL